LGLDRLDCIAYNQKCREELNNRRGKTMAIKVCDCKRCEGTGSYWMANAAGSKVCYACGGSGKKLTGQPRKGLKDINGPLVVGDKTEVRTGDFGWAVVEITEVWTKDRIDCPPPKIARRLQDAARVLVGKRVYDGKTLIF